MQFGLDNIRFDDSLGQARAETFLAENPDPGVRERPDELFRRAMLSGQCLQYSLPDNALCGLSMVFPYDPGNHEPVFHEIGAMRITSNGFGLQAFVAWFHLVQLYIEDPGNLGETFAVVTPDTPSQHNLVRRVGMASWNPPPLLRHLRREEGVPFLPDKPVLLADRGAVSNAFHALAELHDEGRVFRSPKGAATIEARMRWFDPAILKEGP